jgi:hypothetical protein
LAAIPEYNVEARLAAFSAVRRLTQKLDEIILRLNKHDRLLEPNG